MDGDGPVRNAEFFSSNLNSILLTEIALEGLEGITLQSLWIRLRENFSWQKQTVKTGDPNFQESAWKLISKNANVQMFVLPEQGRRPVIPENEYRNIEDFTKQNVEVDFKKRKKNCDEESEDDGSAEEADNEPSNQMDLDYGGARSYTRGWEKERQALANPLNSYGVWFKKNQVMRGSCRFLEERRDVTEELRKMKLGDVQSQYGDLLVLVASVSTREKILGIDKLPEKSLNSLTQNAYVVLEVIARHRHHGHFLIYRGWTMFGRGSRNLKQIHNYASVLQELGLITKDKGRFGKMLSTSDNLQQLTYLFLKSMSRKVHSPMDSFIADIDKKIREAPPPGYPSLLLPRFPGVEDRQDTNFRRRLRRYFPKLQIVSVPKESLEQLYPELSTNSKTTATIVCCSFGEEFRFNKSATSANLKVQDFVIPDDLVIKTDKSAKALILAGLQMLKANRERGLSVPDLTETFGRLQFSRRMTATCLRRMISMGYVKQDGRFPGKNFPKRYVLVASEEERKSLLTEQGDNTTKDEDFDESRAKSKTVKTGTDVSALKNSRFSKQILLILKIAAELRVFSDPAVLNDFGKFFEPRFEKISSGALCELVSDAVDSGDLEVRFFPITKSKFRGIDPVNRNLVEMAMVMMSSSTATEENLTEYLTDLNFRAAITSYSIKPWRASHLPAAVSCSDVYEQSRLSRLRIMHRYLFCLAHESAEAPPGGLGSWREHIQHSRFANNFKGWLTMDQIIQRMPLGVFARMVPVREPTSDPDGVIKHCIENRPACLWPICRQNARVLRHIFSDRIPIHILRTYLFGLRCMGLVSLGPAGGNTNSPGGKCIVMYPERIETFYIHSKITVKDTAKVPAEDISYGLMKPEVSAATPNKLVEFRTDEDIVAFWQEIGTQAISFPAHERGKGGASSNKSNQNPNPNQNRLSEVYETVFPNNVDSKSHPPGDKLAIFGFDSSLTLHKNMGWKLAGMASRRLLQSRGYISELDDLKMDWTVIKLQQKSLKTTSSTAGPKPKTFVMKTGGKRLKPGPKPKLRGSNAEIVRLFRKTNIGQLFRQARPWQCCEELVSMIFIGARDLIRAVRKRPVNMQLLSDLMEEFFPELDSRRSRRELEVRLIALQRDFAFMQGTRLAGQIIQQHPEFKMVKLHFKSSVVEDHRAMKAVYQSWKRLVHMGMDAIFKSGWNLRKRILEAAPKKNNNISQKEAAQQFALENLILFFSHTNKNQSPEMAEVMNRYNDRVIVGTGTFFNFRGVLASRKPSTKVHDSGTITIGRISMGLSWRFSHTMNSVGESVLGSAVRASNVLAVGDQEIDPRTVLPHWLRPIRDAHSADGSTSKQADRNLQVLEKSSFTVEPEFNAPVDQKRHKSIRLHGFHFRNAVPGLLETAKMIQNSVKEKFVELKSSLEKPIKVLDDSDLVAEVFVALGFELSVEIYTKYAAMYDFIRNSKEEGISKAILWNLMESSTGLSLPVCQSALDCLIERNLVIPAGIEQVAYVAAPYVDAWVYRPNENDLLAFQPRPWLTANGHISPPVLLMYLQWISWHICEKRVLSLGNLLSEFRPYLLGRNTLELVSILKKLGFIKKIRYVAEEESSFLEISEVTEWMDDGDFDQIFVRCSANAWEFAMGMSFLEEEFGIFPKTIFPEIFAENFENSSENGEEISKPEVKIDANELNEEESESESESESKSKSNSDSESESESDSVAIEIGEREQETVQSSEENENSDDEIHELSDDFWEDDEDDEDNDEDSENEEDN